MIRQDQRQVRQGNEAMWKWSLVSHRLASQRLCSTQLSSFSSATLHHAVARSRQATVPPHFVTSQHRHCNITSDHSITTPCKSSCQKNNTTLHNYHTSKYHCSQHKTTPTSLQCLHVSPYHTTTHHFSLLYTNPHPHTRQHTPCCTTQQTTRHTAIEHSLDRSQVLPELV